LAVLAVDVVSLGPCGGEVILMGCEFVSKFPGNSRGLGEHLFYWLLGTLARAGFSFDFLFHIFLLFVVYCGAARALARRGNYHFISASAWVGEQTG